MSFSEGYEDVRANIEGKAQLFPFQLSLPYSDVFSCEETCTVQNIPAGKYSINVYSEGYQEKNVVITVPKSLLINKNIELEKTFQLLPFGDMERQKKSMETKVQDLFPDAANDLIINVLEEIIFIP